MAALAGREEALRLKERLRDADRRHHVHSFTDHEALSAHGAFIVERAEGCMLHGEGGIALLDAMAGLGCVNVGYGRRELAAVAAEAMEELAFYHSFQSTTHPHAALLAEKLASLAPGALDRVFFANSGSEANETIVKLARAYWRAKGQPQRRLILARDYGYHGSTMYMASLSGLPQMHEAFGLPLADVAHIEAPYWYRQGGAHSPEAYGRIAADALRRKIAEVGADHVAAFIAEPVQMTAGAIVPPDGYWDEIVAICRENDILLIADEVVTGFGRTGHWFAQEHFGFEADFMTCAKGLSSAYQPIAAAVMSTRVAEIALSQKGPFQHGFTTSGHPVACAVARENIAIIEREGLIAASAEKGAYLHKTLRSELGDHRLVGEIRGFGLFAGIEICREKEGRRQFPIEAGIDSHVANAALMEGVIVRATGNSLVVCPPLIVTHAEIDRIASALGNALDRVASALSQAS